MPQSVQTLKQFLEFPLWTSAPVFDLFKSLEGAIFRENPNNRLERFVYIEGTKPDKVVLIAHADTYFDHYYAPDTIHVEHSVVEQDGFFYSHNDHQLGLGADDRAGCAMLWLCRDSGHSLLITDGEEHGLVGAEWLMRAHPDIAERLNTQHQFMIQLDRRHSQDFKCYSVGTDAFREFIGARTGYTEPDRKARTDIVTLCTQICGVNLSIGYYAEHTQKERINIQEWAHSLSVLTALLEGDLPHFPLHTYPSQQVY